MKVPFQSTTNHTVHEDSHYVTRMKSRGVCVCLFRCIKNEKGVSTFHDMIHTHTSYPTTRLPNTHRSRHIGYLLLLSMLIFFRLSTSLTPSLINTLISLSTSFTCVLFSVHPSLYNSSNHSTGSLTLLAHSPLCIISSFSKCAQNCTAAPAFQGAGVGLCPSTITL